MSIYIGEISFLSLKDAIERTQKGEIINIVTHEVLEREIKRIGREAGALQRPKDLSYITTVPSTDDLSEAQSVLYKSGATVKRYTKVAGIIYEETLTAT